MGLTKLDVILQSLDSAGWKKETPILIISRGTCKDEQVISADLMTIGKEVEQKKPQQPALIIVGHKVNITFISMSLQLISHKNRAVSDLSYRYKTNSGLITCLPSSNLARKPLYQLV